jgi:hypothetical protein
MSLDYPKRADWLKVRATPAKRKHNFSHVSKWPVPITLPNGTKSTIWNSKTLIEGRNAEKRAAKSKKARTNMLAERRLRQRMGDGVIALDEAA